MSLRISDCGNLLGLVSKLEIAAVVCELSPQSSLAMTRLIKVQTTSLSFLAFRWECNAEALDSWMMNVGG